MTTDNVILLLITLISIIIIRNYIHNTLNIHTSGWQSNYNGGLTFIHGQNHQCSIVLF